MTPLEKIFGFPIPHEGRAWNHASTYVDGILKGIHVGITTMRKEMNNDESLTPNMAAWQSRLKAENVPRKAQKVLDEMIKDITLSNKFNEGNDGTHEGTELQSETRSQENKYR